MLHSGQAFWLLNSRSDHGTVTGVVGVRYNTITLQLKTALGLSVDNGALIGSGDGTGNGFQPDATNPGAKKSFGRDSGSGDQWKSQLPSSDRTHGE